MIGGDPLPQLAQIPYKELEETFGGFSASKGREEILNRTLGGGILLKREGWLINVYLKCGERFPNVSIRRSVK